VLVSWPGADAAQIERLMLNPLEEEIAQVDEVKELRGTARLGFAQLIVGMHQHVYDTDAVWQRIRVAVERAERKFPEGAGQPEVLDRMMDTEGIVLAITGSARTCSSWRSGPRAAARPVPDERHRAHGADGGPGRAAGGAAGSLGGG
jgi:multidrug efflux pump subunit AcrB